jgi:hypothetical protein
MSDRIERTAPLLAIYAGQRCTHFVLARGRAGFELFDADEISRGLFPTQQAAISAASTPSTAASMQTEET